LIINLLLDNGLSEKFLLLSNNKNVPNQPVIFKVHGGFAAMNPGADFGQHRYYAQKRGK
jgi:hypothetical protein